MERLQNIPKHLLTTTNWWYGKAKSVYSSPVDELSALRHVEVSARVFGEPPVPGQTVSWGVPVTNEKVFSRFEVGLLLETIVPGMCQSDC